MPGSYFWLASTRLYFITAAIAFVAALPLLWGNLLPYQRERIFTFLDPERDPLGAGYHLLQSKIALGSADMWGKGSMKGSQSQLNFLPEKHTDFIFAMFTEERGFLGAMGLMGLYMLSFGLLVHHGLAHQKPLWPPADCRHGPHLVFICGDQYGHGHGHAARGWGPAALDVLWWHQHIVDHVWPWRCHQRLCTSLMQNK